MKNYGGGELKGELTLRQRAEAFLAIKQATSDSARSETDVLRLVHELEVHQIELEMVNEELLVQNQEKEKRVSELIFLNKKLSINLELIATNKELVLLNVEKEKRAAELVVANKELLFQNDEKTQRAEELILSNIELAIQIEEKAKRAAELVNANKELVFQNEEKSKRAAELIIANKELLFQNDEKTRRAEELIIANIELLFQNDEKAKRAAELILSNKELLLSNDEKAKLAVKLVLANKELLFQNDEKTHRADELILANIELLFQNHEKEKRAAELVIANQLISSQRDRLQEISSLVPGVVYQYRLRPDGTSCFPYASKAINRIYQVTPEEVREDAGKVFANLHPDDHDGVVTSIHTSAKELTPWQHEYRVKFEDGTIRTLFGNALPRLEEDGSVLWHGFITDITETKRSVDELRQSEERFRVVVEQSPMANVVHRNGIIIYANPAAVKMFGGSSLHDLVGTRIWDRIHPDFHPIVLERVRNGMEDGTNVPLMQFRYIKFDGAIIDAEAQGTTINYDGVPCIHDVMRDVTERNRLENLLKENNSRLSGAMQMAKMAWWEMDVLTGKVSFDQRKVEMLGYSPENFTHYNDFTDLIHPDDHKKAMNAMRGHFTGLFDRYEVEYRILSQSGEYKWFYNNGSIVKRDDKGKPLYISGFVLDITDRKLAEESLRKSEARYSAMISNISDVIGIMGADGLMNYKSANIEKFFGWLPEERLGTSGFSTIHPDDIAHVQKEFYSILGEDNSVKTLEFRYECKDGSYKPIELTAANLLNDPVINGVLLNYRDITNRKANEEEKFKADTTIRTLSSAVSQSPITLVITDLAGNIESVNPRFTETTGYTAEEVIGKNSRILQAGDKPICDYKDLWDTILAGRNWYGVFHNKKKNGELYWESAVISSVKDQYGITTHFLSVKEDITSRLESERELKHKNEELQKVNAEKDKFFSIIAHDLRGPLGGFMGLTEMMADENQYFTDIERKELTQGLSLSARTTFTLLENLLEWSQIDRGLTDFRPQNLDLKVLVSECINILAEPARIKAIALVANIPDELIVLADKNMVHTVIRNLLSNAIKFTPSGGTVTISAKSTENCMTVIYVKDTGIGIPDTIRNNLFRIDANTKRPGTNGEQSTGLGLLLCKEFVEKNGGKIGVESLQEGGSVFNFTIPSKGQSGDIINEKIESTVIQVIKINNPKILIAEDDVISGKLLAAMIKGFSKEILIVKTGIDVVETIRNNPDIDLILLDISMPELDGYEATRQIRQFNTKVVIIAQTALASNRDIEMALSAGCNDHIAKPVKIMALKSLILKYFDKLE